MAHAAGLPTLHDTGHLFGMAFDAAQGLLGQGKAYYPDLAKRKFHVILLSSLICLLTNPYVSFLKYLLAASIIFL